ncbi:signal peptide, CUB and EGF-like domain-containing protein 2 [Tachypleus tridentatus]|uniref:signal peptide, CUB and EGF-like domain-containing protein 2 n=1 Tax=Tachypleus tridentatus TaxID=6853 RepID=UPI003FD5B9CA
MQNFLFLSVTVNELKRFNFLLFSSVYVPAENLTCTRGYRRDADRCCSCPPGHYDNGLQTSCLSCPGGTYMAHLASDACIPYPGDKITDKEGADNKDLCISNDFLLLFL